MNAWWGVMLGAVLLLMLGTITFVNFEVTNSQLDDLKTRVTALENLATGEPERETFQRLGTR